MLQISFNLRGEIRDWLIETVVAYYVCRQSGPRLMLGASII